MNFICVRTRTSQFIFPLDVVVVVFVDCRISFACLLRRLRVRMWQCMCTCLFTAIAKCDGDYFSLVRARLSHTLWIRTSVERWRRMSEIFSSQRNQKRDGNDLWFGYFLRVFFPAAKECLIGISRPSHLDMRSNHFDVATSDILIFSNAHLIKCHENEQQAVCVRVRSI